MAETPSRAKTVSIHFAEVQAKTISTAGTSGSAAANAADAFVYGGDFTADYTQSSGAAVDGSRGLLYVLPRTF